MGKMELSHTSEHRFLDAINMASKQRSSPVMRNRTHGFVVRRVSELIDMSSVGTVLDGVKVIGRSHSTFPKCGTSPTTVNTGITALIARAAQYREGVGRTPQAVKTSHKKRRKSY